MAYAYSRHKATPDVHARWRDDAACRYQARLMDDPARQYEAIALCLTCPVRGLCLTWAMEDEPGCVAGGLTERERRRLRKSLRARREAA